MITRKLPQKIQRTDKKKITTYFELHIGHLKINQPVKSHKMEEKRKHQKTLLQRKPRAAEKRWNLIELNCIEFFLFYFAWLIFTQVNSKMFIG